MAASASPSVSPSNSPSVSPSASRSPSVSPSVSPSQSPSASVSPSRSPSVSPSASKSPSVSPSVSPSFGLDLQHVYMVGADPAGDIQQINAGKHDDSTPIYYELETQELEFDNRIMNKRISDKLVVFSENAADSKIEIIPDTNDAIPVPIPMGKRINTITLPILKGHYITLRWSGHTTTKSPILEGFYLNKIKDDGYG